MAAITKPPTATNKHSPRSRLFVNLQAGEIVQIGDVTVTIVAKSGRRVKLAIEAPDDVSITADLVKAAMEGAMTR